MKSRSMNDVYGQRIFREMTMYHVPTSVCTPSCPVNYIAVDDTNDNQLVFGEFSKDFTAGLIFLDFPTLGRFSRRLAVFGSNEQDG